jgi:hypothetical protein
MKKSGCLRRAVILLAFGVFYSAFVISDGRIIPDTDQQKWLHWLLIGAITWGIVTMFAERLSPPKTGKENKDDAE